MQITFIEANESISPLIAEAYGDAAARHLCFDGGFTLAAFSDAILAGFIGLSWRSLPHPLEQVRECFIDIIEVAPRFRRQGIACGLVRMAEERAREGGAYQIRAWSSEDRTEAIAMWKTFGYGLAPAAVHPRGIEVRGVYASKTLQAAV